MSKLSPGRLNFSPPAKLILPAVSALFQCLRPKEIPSNRTEQIEPKIFRVRAVFDQIPSLSFLRRFVFGNYCRFALGFCRRCFCFGSKENLLPIYVLKNISAEKVAAVRKSNIENLRLELTDHLDNIILKALSKKPSERYDSAKELFADITRYLDGKQVYALLLIAMQ